MGMKPRLLAAITLLTFLVSTVAAQQGGVVRQGIEQLHLESLARQARDFNVGPTIPVTFTFDGSALPQGTLWLVNIIYATTGNRKDGVGAGMAQPFVVTLRGESGKSFSLSERLPDSGTLLVQVLVTQAGNPRISDRSFSRSLGLGRGKGVEVLVSDRAGDNNDLILLNK
jgi:hypothetical protein